MKYAEILEEEPVYDPTEMPKGPTIGELFFSEDTLEREYIFIKELQLSDRQFYVFIQDDHSSVVIGEGGNRRIDNKPGIFIDGQLTLKHSLDLGQNVDISKLGSMVVQVDLVKINSRRDMAGDIRTAMGLGFELYHSVIEKGFTLISDTLQYRGGKALWKKIAPLSSLSGFAVYILKNGEFISDDSGHAIPYTGSNIPDSAIWSENEENKHVLLVAKKL